MRLKDMVPRDRAERLGRLGVSDKILAKGPSSHAPMASETFMNIIFRLPGSLLTSVMADVNDTLNKPNS